MNRALSFLSTVLGLIFLVGPALAQEPKVGRDWYEDSVDLGFKLKAPKDWDFIPPQPLEPNIVGKYAPPQQNYMTLGGDAALFLNMWIVKFDRREHANQPEERDIGGQKYKIETSGVKDIDAWMTEELREGSGWRFDRKKYPKALKGLKVAGGAGCPRCKGAGAEYYVYDGTSSTQLQLGRITRGLAGDNPQPIQCYVAVVHLQDDVDIALVGIGPGEKKWRPYEKAYAKMAKSLKTIEVERLASAVNASDAASPRGKKRAKLEEEVAKSAGWELYETPNYFIISSYNDKQFIDELMERLEAIRAVYEVDYPAEKARKIKRAEGEPETDADGEGAKKKAEDEDRTISVINPLDLSRTSVVRVCKDFDEYRQYGGLPGTGGYWHSLAEELVIFDDKADRGTDFTWNVMNHEAFHQYIYYFYGNLAPHSWYNEGTGDYYSGFDYKRKKFKEKAENGRKLAVQKIIGEGRHVPLEEFVGWSKSQYYGSNDNGLAGHECYAQGWSLIWFLRTGAKKANGWDKSWNGILDVYLEKLAETGKTDKAVETAFEGVDWAKFEKAWLDYID